MKYQNVYDSKLVLCLEHYFNMCAKLANLLFGHNTGNGFPQQLPDDPSVRTEHAWIFDDLLATSCEIVEPSLNSNPAKNWVAMRSFKSLYTLKLLHIIFRQFEVIYRALIQTRELPSAQHVFTQKKTYRKLIQSEWEMKFLPDANFAFGKRCNQQKAKRFPEFICKSFLRAELFSNHKLRRKNVCSLMCTFMRASSTDDRIYSPFFFAPFFLFRLEIWID